MRHQMQRDRRLAPIRTVAPAEPPVSLEEIKRHVRAEEFADDDMLLQAYVDAATSYLDGYGGVLGRAIVKQSWQQDFAGFSDCMRLPLGPLNGNPAISYFDRDNASQTLPTSVYTALSDALGPFVSLKQGQSWPATYARPDAVSITFDAGTEIADVEPSIKVAIMLLAAHWYANREAVGEGLPVELPFAVSALIAPYRRTSL